MKICNPLRERKSSGFTLVELLVAICVLVVLVAMLSGGIGMAHRSVDLSRCTQNLRQLNIAFHSYVTDNNGVLPDKTPKRLYPYLGLTDQESYQNTAFTCPAIQRSENAALGSYNRTSAINIYATTEKIKDPDRITRIQQPSKMILYTEGKAISNVVAPDGSKGKTYFSTTRLEDADELLFPHGNGTRQNAVFVDGSVRLIDKAEFYQAGSWNTLFWRGY